MNPAIARRRRARIADARQREEGSHERQPVCHVANVGQTERQISLLGGGILAAYGLMRGSLSGLALAALGGALVWRGYSGHCELYHAMGHSSADDGQGRSRKDEQPRFPATSGQASSPEMGL